MRKRNFLFGVIFLCTPLLFSQNIGFNFGLNYSRQFNKTLSSNEAFDRFGSRMGIRLGVDYKAKIATSLFFMTGVNFNQKGDNVDANEENTNRVLENKLRLNYLELPITFLIVSDDRPRSPYVQIGCYGAYRINGKFDDVDFAVEDFLKKLDIGASLAVGYSFKPYSIGLGYDLGISDLFDFSEAPIETRNGNFQLTFRYWPSF